MGKWKQWLPLNVLSDRVGSAQQTSLDSFKRRRDAQGLLRDAAQGCPGPAGELTSQLTWGVAGAQPPPSSGVTHSLHLPDMIKPPRVAGWHALR